MTTFQQAIDYVNSFVPVMYPGSDFRYSEALNSTDRIVMLGVQKLLGAGHTVDSIPPTGREPAEIYRQAITRLQVMGAEIDAYQAFNNGKLNTSVGRVYMAMLDNPPKDAPKPSDGYTQADLDAAEKRGWNAALDMIETTVKGAGR